MDLLNFTEEAGMFTDVRAWTDDGNVRALTLHFANNTQLHIFVEQDTDELVVSTSSVLNQQCTQILTTLQDVYGYLLIRTWLMHNHKGYQDALQLEFYHPDKSQTHFIQIYVVASSLTLFRLQQIVV